MSVELTVEELDAEIRALEKRRDRIARLPAVTPDMLKVGYAVLKHDGDDALSRAFLAMFKASPYLMGIIDPPSPGDVARSQAAYIKKAMPLFAAEPVVKTWLPEFYIDEAPNARPLPRPSPDDWLINEDGVLAVGPAADAFESVIVKPGGHFAFIGFSDGKEDDFATQFKLTSAAGVLKFEPYVPEPIASTEESDDG